MSLLLLDPLVLLLHLGVAVHGWRVYSGRFTAWFRPDRLWLGLWPAPAVVAVVPLVVGPLLRALDALADDSGLLHPAAFLLANAVPIVVLCVAPPRMLLPRWARRRLVPPPGDGVPAAGSAPTGAVPALNASRVTARVAWPRWRWRIDAVPGHAWVADGQLLFRADDAGEAIAGGYELDQDEIDQLELQLGEDLRLQPPRGGWWTRRRVDLDLEAVDAWHVTATRWWDRAGLVTLQVSGRAPIRLWTPAADELRGMVAREIEPPPSR